MQIKKQSGKSSQPANNANREEQEIGKVSVAACALGAEHGVSIVTRAPRFGADFLANGFYHYYSRQFA
jgi:hypothetical protein